MTPGRSPRSSSNTSTPAAKSASYKSLESLKERLDRDAIHSACNSNKKYIKIPITKCLYIIIKNSVNVTNAAVNAANAVVNDINEIKFYHIINNNVNNDNENDD